MSHALDPTDDPVAALEELACARAPWLFGVRHHSPACAIALPALLDELAPTVVAVELPADLERWLAWLGHPDADAPLAIAAVSERGHDLGFYPFADFSPELAAIRWARGRGVPVAAIDLPSSQRPPPSGGASPRGEAGPQDADRPRSVRLAPPERGGEVLGIERRLRGAEDDSWDQLVESPGIVDQPERVRRAALVYGWALRLDAARGDGVSELDLAREAHMRAALARLGAVPGARVAAVIGSFHAAALLPSPRLWQPPAPYEAVKLELVSSLIPYAFELLDARSGYPAGIRDPQWQQRLWQTRRDGGDVGALVAACLVEITRGVRARGLPASLPDAQAAAEIASSLARLRGLAVPGRRELVEAVQTTLTHGELLGRGRIVAKAMDHVLVGRQRGHLAPGTPRSGLGPHVAQLFAELSLPYVAAAEPVVLRLDPLRSRIDRRRHVALCRVRACGIPYGSETESIAVGGVEALTVSWTVHATPSTEAMIELAGLRGVTLRQAAAGALRAAHARMSADDKLTVDSLVGLAELAAETGTGELLAELLAELAGARLSQATLSELIAVLALLDRIAAGHVVALPVLAEDAVPGEIDVYAAPVVDRDAILSAAVAQVIGLAGSEQLADATALAELVRVLDRAEHQRLGDGRLRWSIDQLVAIGTPVIAGAASVIQVLVGTTAPEVLSTALGAWLDAAVDREARRVLASRLRGALAIAGPLFEAAPVFLDGLVARVEQISDEEFLARVASLREGFEVLSTAARRRLLRVLGDRLGDDDARGHGLDVMTAIDPVLLAAAAEADRAGRAAIAAVPRPVLAAVASSAAASPVHHVAPVHDVPVRDRWRMILGHERPQLRPRSARAARALDELYGSGHGEGSRSEQGGGQESAFPTVRAWREEIEVLFGASVFEEVAARAAAGGRIGALLELDPAQVTPSVELLQQVLSLKGGLGEAHLGRLRVLIRRVVDELVRELAVRVRPALQGATSPRATRRPTRALHLPRTIAANLAKVQRVSPDEVRLVPERLYFKERSRRHLDWHVVLVVDVSGSMEPSVIYSAMMAAILSSVPWISVRFVAFSTEVVDLSEHVHDPLALLLEVAIGGGTHIAKGLAYARGLITVPQRTIVLLLSDFEEGFAVESLIGEVRALAEAGVTCLGLAALDDHGAPRYAVAIAEEVAAAGMPIAALTPLELARWVGDKIR